VDGHARKRAVVGHEPHATERHHVARAEELGGVVLERVKTHIAHAGGRERHGLVVVALADLGRHPELDAAERLERPAVRRYGDVHGAHAEVQQTAGRVLEIRDDHLLQIDRPAQVEHQVLLRRGPGAR